ncbi:LysR family transcriptional regulator [Zhongshania aquimaris]|uniref:LysR family transcriptional regulator n=1 Tax=Zhongshania aquimaris TaxID=2857107 RepID=A0ABS6VRY5_9GAMM|nr:LysR family transcriptional regulator [Zhongshania aquimaris]MBW2941082.1 LysR family transcriptional regulator [Zhongshania aquimaris]
MAGPRTNLEQWYCFLAVVDEGSYARAAEVLHKSQSAVTYTIQKMEEQLGVKVFEIQGRKSQLTEVGQMLYRRGRALIDEALRLEKSAKSVAAGWEPQLRIVCDTLFPSHTMLDCLADLSERCPDTRIECVETVLSGAEEALLERRCDVAITGIVPPGFLGDHILRVKFIAVAHRDHALHKLDRQLDYRDLRPFRQVVVRDSGVRRQRDAGWLEAAQRLTVSRMELSISAVARGLGFAWLPEIAMEKELESGEIMPLPMIEGGERYADLFLILPNRDLAGAAALRCEALIKAATENLVC